MNADDKNNEQPWWEEIHWNQLTSNVYFWIGCFTFLLTIVFTAHCVSRKCCATKSNRPSALQYIATRTHDADDDLDDFSSIFKHAPATPGDEDQAEESDDMYSDDANVFDDDTNTSFLSTSDKRVLEMISTKSALHTSGSSI